MSDYDDLVAALSPVSAALAKLGIRHYVGGSVASSFHGASRSTMEVDSRREHDRRARARVSEKLWKRLLPQRSRGLGRDSAEVVLQPDSFPTSFKVDVFVSCQRPFDVTAMNRATMERLGDNHVLEIHVATPEDAIISKLEWYRKTNETSERQWDDVTRLLKLLGDAIDMQYLSASAESVGVQDLLERLLSTL